MALVELAKIGALAALAGLTGARWLGDLDAAWLGVLVLYLLAVRLGRPAKPGV